jgi:hypothetical protein
VYEIEDETIPNSNKLKKRSTPKKFQIALLPPTQSITETMPWIGKTIECCIDSKTQAWKPVIERNGRVLFRKKAANEWMTVKSTLDLIAENLSEDDVFLFHRHPGAQSRNFVNMT